jgi:26S proteasome regulatory subunit N3
MGDIPERGVFRQPVLKKALVPYLQIVQGTYLKYLRITSVQRLTFPTVSAVRVGDLSAFTTALQSHQKQFLSDGTYTLILRLRHNVIKTALRTLSLAYSRIPLQEICKKLHLDSEEEAEYVCAKAIRDGVIEASLEHEKGYMKSRDVVNIYGTNEPQKAFNQRINFCLQLHNESVKVSSHHSTSHTSSFLPFVPLP